ERLAVDRHHHRLGRILYRQQNRQERSPRFLARGHLAEFADVGAGDKRRARSDDYHRLYLRVLRRRFYGRLNPLGNAGTQRIHRRVVDRDDSYVLNTSEFYQFIHKVSYIDDNNRPPSTTSVWPV